LLRLVCWCRQQHAASTHPEQGGFSCSPASPPAPRDQRVPSRDHSSTGATLDATGADEATRATHATESDSLGTADSCNRQGASR
jgi:hypothetical protein